MPKAVAQIVLLKMTSRENGCAAGVLSFSGCIICAGGKSKRHDIGAEKGRTGMSRYIRADHYAERLRQLLQAYSSAGWQSAIDTALRMLETEPDWERTDVSFNWQLDHLHMDDDAERLEVVKTRMAERLGRYAARQGLLAYEDVCPCGYTRILTLRGAFFKPIQPVFKEPKEVIEDAGSQTY
jgi:hypothetical protein